MVSKKSIAPDWYKRLLVLTASVPGYVFLLLGWVAILVTIIHFLTVQTHVVTLTVPAEPSRPVLVIGDIPRNQGGALMFTTLAIWFVIALLARKLVRLVASRFDNKLKAQRIMTIGGSLLVWSILAVASAALQLGSALVAFSIMVGVVSVMSFLTEQALAYFFKIDIVR